MFEGHDEWILASLGIIDTDIWSEWLLIIDCLSWYTDIWSEGHDEWILASLGIIKTVLRWA